MNIIYSVVFLIMAKLFHSVYKNHRANKKQIHNKSNELLDKTDFKSSIEMPKELGKNKWLHPTDEFGKMEEGIVK